MVVNFVIKELLAFLHVYSSGLWKRSLNAWSVQQIMVYVPSKSHIKPAKTR